MWKYFICESDELFNYEVKAELPEGSICTLSY